MNIKHLKEISGIYKYRNVHMMWCVGCLGSSASSLLNISDSAQQGRRI
jgi:hypothetical protein